MSEELTALDSLKEWILDRIHTHRSLQDHWRKKFLDSEPGTKKEQHAQEKEYHYHIMIFELQEVLSQIKSEKKRLTNGTDF